MTVCCVCGDPPNARCRYCDKPVCFERSCRRMHDMKHPNECPQYQGKAE